MLTINSIFGVMIVTENPAPQLWERGHNYKTEQPGLEHLIVVALLTRYGKPSSAKTLEDHSYQ